ncbi:hypothetical protein WAI453_005979 [Rhynchosporium graminicola]|uniref:COP9 signalosome complex subunit 3 n=1 Tax=Rhynchosporium graminicola TaxID=2792576 RepID=A0A1E1L7V1_9HELO|nr:related to JAB1-containing signalosome subunit 3 [Rhynchosporium commune]
MEDLLSKLHSFPPLPAPRIPLSDQQYDEGIKSQIEAVKKISDAKMMQPTAGGENMLQVIDPAFNTVPYAFCLVANVQATSKNTAKSVNMDILWSKMVQFLQVFDARQIRYLGDELNYIIKSVADFARSSRQPHLAVAPIRNAILRLDPSGSMLTANHLTLVKLAMESRRYVDAAPALKKFILYVPGYSALPKPKYLCDMSLSPAAYITPATKLNTKLKYQDILEYFLYSGMVHIGLVDWENAFHCLESAVTYPSKDSSPSKIMVEAYKKWILVGLLKEGQYLPLPKSTSPGPGKSYHTLAKPYEALAQIFESGTASRVKSEIEAGTTWWRNDGNTGLILQVQSAFQRFAIRDLGDVYSKISIPEVFSQTTSAETGYKLQNLQAGEALVQQMIQRGDLHATLSHPPTGPAILTFSPSGAALSERQMQSELAAATARIQDLTKEIKQTDRMVTYDKEYVKFMQKIKKSKEQHPEQDAPGAGWNESLDDEDIMSMY